MKYLITDQEELIAPWVASYSGGAYVPGTGKTMSLGEDGQVIAAVLYDAFNGANIHVSIAAIPGKRWMTKAYLWAIFDYPFNQLQARRMTALVADSNTSSKKFVEHLGFTLEATLEEAHPTGNLLVYVMHKRDCKWINSLRFENGQVKSTQGTKLRE